MIRPQTEDPPLAAQPGFSYAYYERVLTTALEQGYVFVGPEEIRARALPPYAVLLRHDCDFDLPSTLPIAELEHALGIRALYHVLLTSPLYNALAAEAIAIVRTLHALGHRIALHFDESRLAAASADAVAAEIARDTELLERAAGCPVEAVSFHQPSARVLDGSLRIAAFNTYDRTGMEDFVYVSDSSGVLRADFPAIFRRHDPARLHLLFHTDWWNSDALSHEERWSAMFGRAFAAIDETLWRSVPAYLRRQHATFTPTGPARLLPESKIYRDKFIR